MSKIIINTINVQNKLLVNFSDVIRLNKETSLLLELLENKDSNDDELYELSENINNILGELYDDLHKGYLAQCNKSKDQ